MRRTTKMSPCMAYYQVGSDQRCTGQSSVLHGNQEVADVSDSTQESTHGCEYVTEHASDYVGVLTWLTSQGRTTEECPCGQQLSLPACSNPPTGRNFTLEEMEVIAQLT